MLRLFTWVDLGKSSLQRLYTAKVLITYSLSILCRSKAMHRSFLDKLFITYILKHQKNFNGGFTLLELIVVVLITAILSVIALPSMLNQANRAREASVLSDIGAVNRSQQAYRLEHPTFANDISSLSINVSNTSNGYTYSFGAISSNIAEFRATPGNTGLKAFTGCATAASGANNTTTSTRIEESGAGGSPPNC